MKYTLHGSFLFQSVPMFGLYFERKKHNIAETCFGLMGFCFFFWFHCGILRKDEQKEKDISDELLRFSQAMKKL